MPDSPSPQDLFEMFQKMMNPMAFPMQHLLMPSLSVEDIDKKISDLRAVENWLKTNLALLDLSIKSLEYQRALLDNRGKEGESPPVLQNPFLDPKLWGWNFFNAASSEAAQPSAKPSPAKPRRGRKKPG